MACVAQAIETWAVLFYAIYFWSSSSMANSLIHQVRRNANTKQASQVFPCVEQFLFGLICIAKMLCLFFFFIFFSKNTVRESVRIDGWFAQFLPRCSFCHRQNSLCPVVSVNNLVTKWRLGAEALPSFSRSLLEMISLRPVGGGLGMKNSTTPREVFQILIWHSQAFSLFLLLVGNILLRLPEWNCSSLLFMPRREKFIPNVSVFWIGVFSLKLRWDQLWSYIDVII